MDEKEIIEQLKKGVAELERQVGWFKSVIQTLEAQERHFPTQPSDANVAKTSYKGKYPDAPATRFQKDYLEFLNIKAPSGLTRAQASDLIKKAKQEG